MLSTSFLRCERVPVLVSLGTRVKPTCVDAHRNLLAFGSNTGSVYLYQLSPLIFLKLLNFDNNKSVRTQDPITLIRFNPGQPDLIAVASSRTVFVIDVKARKLKTKEKIIHRVRHKDADVSCIEWDEKGKCLFSGDRQGVVRRIPMDMFKPAEAMASCGSEVFQIFAHKQTTLVVSTLTRTLIFNAQINGKGSQEYIQVGTKERNGPFGSCFVPKRDAADTSMLLAARPGKRLWTANPRDGSVIQTLKIKLPRPAIFTENFPFSFPHPRPPKCPKVNFSQLLPFQGGIACVNMDCLLFVDPHSIAVHSWFAPDQFGSILSWSVDGKSIYILHEESDGTSACTKICRVRAVPPSNIFEEFLQRLLAGDSFESNMGAAKEGKTTSSVRLEWYQSVIEQCVTKAIAVAQDNSYSSTLRVTATSFWKMLENFTKSRDLVHQDLQSAGEVLLQELVRGERLRNKDVDVQALKTAPTESNAAAANSPLESDGPIQLSRRDTTISKKGGLSDIDSGHKTSSSSLDSTKELHSASSSEKQPTKNNLPQRQMTSSRSASATTSSILKSLDSFSSKAANVVKTKAAAAKAAAVKAAAEVKQEIKGAQVERGRNSSARAPQENEQKMPDNSGGYTFVPAMAPFAPAEEAQQAPRNVSNRLTRKKTKIIQITIAPGKPGEKEIAPSGTLMNVARTLSAPKHTRQKKKTKRERKVKPEKAETGTEAVKQNSSESSLTSNVADKEDDKEVPKEASNASGYAASSEMNSDVVKNETFLADQACSPITDKTNSPEASKILPTQSSGETGVISALPKQLDSPKLESPKSTQPEMEFVGFNLLESQEGISEFWLETCWSEAESRLMAGALCPFPGEYPCWRFCEEWDLWMVLPRLSRLLPFAKSIRRLSFVLKSLALSSCKTSFLSRQINCVVHAWIEQFKCSSLCLKLASRTENNMNLHNSFLEIYGTFYTFTKLPFDPDEFNVEEIMPFNSLHAWELKLLQESVLLIQEELRACLCVYLRSRLVVACEKTHSGNSQSCWAVLDFEVFVQNFAVPLVFSCPETSQGANDVVKDSSDENQPSFKSSQEHICRLHALFNEYGHCLVFRLEGLLESLQILNSGTQLAPTPSQDSPKDVEAFLLSLATFKDPLMYTRHLPVLLEVAPLEGIKCASSAFPMVRPWFVARSLEIDKVLDRFYKMFAFPPDLSAFEPFESGKHQPVLLSFQNASFSLYLEYLCLLLGKTAHNSALPSTFNSTSAKPFSESSKLQLTHQHHFSLLSPPRDPQFACSVVDILMRSLHSQPTDAKLKLTFGVPANRVRVSKTTLQGKSIPCKSGCWTENSMMSQQERDNTLKQAFEIALLSFSGSLGQFQHYPGTPEAWVQCEGLRWWWGWQDNQARPCLEEQSELSFWLPVSVGRKPKTDLSDLKELFYLVKTSPPLSPLQMSCMRQCAFAGYFQGLQQLYLNAMEATFESNSEAFVSLARAHIVLSLLLSDAESLSSFVSKYLSVGGKKAHGRVQISLWRFLLRTWVQQSQFKKRLSSNQEQGISLMQILRRLLVVAGPNLCISLIREQDGAFFELLKNQKKMQTFLCEISSAAALQTKQSSLELSLLETIDSYLWTERGTSVRPELRASRLAEAKLGSPPKLEGKQSNVKYPRLANMRQEKRDILANFALSEDEQARSWLTGAQTFEDSRTAFGARLALGRIRCPNCQLPFDVNQEPFLVFACSHTFHAACAVEQTCSLCLGFDF